MKGYEIMIKKFLCIALSICISAACLSACADENSSSASDSGSSAASSEKSSEADSKKEDSSDEKKEDKKDKKDKKEEEEKSSVLFSQPSGVYKDAFSLELSSESGDIYYTTDGSDPSTSDTRIKYEGAIDIKDRKGDPNVVSAVEPELISGNFVKYDRKNKTFTSTVSAPTDDKVDKCSVINAVAELSEGEYSEICTATYFIGTPEEHIQGIK